MADVCSRRAWTSAAELEAEAARWMNAAETLDVTEDKALGRDKNGEEMPDWGANKMGRAGKPLNARPVRGPLLPYRNPVALRPDETRHGSVATPAT
jgi:hypothetical protein